MNRKPVFSLVGLSQWERISHGKFKELCREYKTVIVTFARAPYKMHHILIDKNTFSRLHRNSIVKRFYFNRTT